MGRKRNRDVVKEAKLGKGWCNGCDQAIVDGQKKCPVCGNRDDGPRRFKKPSPYTPPNYDEEYWEFEKEFKKRYLNGDEY